MQTLLPDPQRETTIIAVAHATELVMKSACLRVLQGQGLCLFLLDALQHSAQLCDQHALMLPVALLP